MKHLLISILLTGCLGAKAQNDTLHIKNADTLLVGITINWPDGWSILKEVKADSTIVMYSQRFKEGTDLILESSRGKFGSSIRATPTRGNYTLVIAWSERQRGYRTIFRPYQEGD